MVRSIGQSEYWARNNTNYHRERYGVQPEEYDDTLFPIDCILNHRMTAKGELQYLVKWSGRPYTWADWLPYQNINSDLVMQYNAAHPFKIEKIVADRQTTSGITEYLIKFKRIILNAEVNWYTAEELVGCEDLIVAYNQRKMQKEKRKRKIEKTESSPDSERTLPRRTLRKRTCPNA
ncbi:hypothetical protein QR680_000255 [Steinernema hermaphroditum]|uniref:Chromo domain-containing protein n=1 Tax=Steinernema hermaphroditum TaxID=289476 RepID=A0AA39LDT3_9BILA|nr:hypothetical protein QR680_000255 [Steinernema hermaphroditum]